MELLSVKQVAELTGFSKSFIYQFFRELGGNKIGGKIFFHQDKLEEALKSDSTETRKTKNMELRVPVQGRETQSGRVRNKDGSTGGGNPSPQDIEKAIKRHELN